MFRRTGGRATCGARAQNTLVDLELVLAIDVSQSVDGSEVRLQRNGYVRALADSEVIAAILSAPYGRIAVTYVEWGGPGQMRTVANWHIIDSAESARAYARALRRMSVARGRGTSISSAILNAISLFDGNGFEGMRRVIDVSGDGRANASDLSRVRMRRGGDARGIPDPVLPD